ncbi:MAG: trimethylamine methyltransferase family protein [Candidatus Heimdallarchaeota archaeon]|nr:MAG: trimethylamine methyltransferase family protein [Candidatus Heimdallarchaeota archaeon]
MLLGIQNNFPPLTILSKEQVSEIHQATLKVLEQTGVRVLSQQAVDILKDRKCKIESNKAFLHPELVEDALKKCPSSFTWHSVYPDSKKHIKLEPGRVNYTISHSPTHVIDFEGKRRRSTFTDISEMTRLGDALEMVHLGGSGLSGTVEEIDQRMDLITAAAYRFVYEVQNTDKPLFIPPSGGTPEDAFEFFYLFREDHEDLQRRPSTWAWVNTVSPLMHNETMTDYALGFAMFGLPVLCCPEVMAHATGPTTLGGALVQHNAEVLSLLTMCQLANESYGIAPPPPIVYGTASSILDPRTAQITLGAPEAGLMNVLTAQMARHYNLPTRGTAGCTDSKALDAQAGQESTMNVLLASMAGVNLIVNAIGGLGPGIQAVSYATMIFNNESLKAISRVLRGIEISDEALALDVIHKVGPGGEYLSHPHTLKHFRSEFFIPKLFDRTDYDIFEKSEKQDILARANEIAHEILESHHPPELDKGIVQRLEEILKSIHRKYVSEK